MDKLDYVISQYDFSPVSVRKGRGCIIIETKEEWYEIAEYVGPVERILVQDQIVKGLQGQQTVKVEQIRANREGELLSVDRDKKRYYCRTHLSGKECNPNDLNDCKRSIHALVEMQKSMYLPKGQERRVFHLEEEILRHNRDLIRIRRYIRNRNHRNSFECRLLSLYDHFAGQAQAVMEQLPQYGIYSYEESQSQEGTVCHGDYQFHNCLMNEPFKERSGVSITHFEKWYYDVHMRDFYHFFRKIMEKKNWEEKAGRTMLDAYLSEKKVQGEELLILYFRLSYPEKFWKIMNYYMNHTKSFLQEKNLEKCEKLLEQETARTLFLKRLSIDILPVKAYNIRNGIS